MGKTGSVDQNANARFQRVRLQVNAQRRLFARQGAVVAGWRTYRNRRLGPYFRLAYREGGRQRSIYLGRCAELARRVGQLLAGLQRPWRGRRLFAFCLMPNHWHSVLRTAPTRPLRRSGAVRREGADRPALGG